MDHRRLQRTLFRMQLDPDFARRLRAREREAEDSTGLGRADLAHLRAADPVAVAADRDGRRAAQFERNVAGEFRLSARVGPRPGGRSWAAGFVRSPFFHRAVAADRSLPLAFADYAESLAAQRPGSLFAAFAALEVAMARARREVRETPPPPPGAVVLAGTAHPIEVPGGTYAAACKLGAEIDAGEVAASPPALAPDAAGGSEGLLLIAGPARPGSVARELRVEPLQPAVAAFLDRARDPLDAAARARFARERDLEVAAVEAVARDYVADGVLRAG